MLYDALRGGIKEVAKLSKENNITIWRKSESIIAKIKRLHRKIQNMKHSTSKDEEKRKVKVNDIKLAHQAYLQQAEYYLERARATRFLLSNVLMVSLCLLDSLIVHAERQIDQIRRRVLLGETIPHAEKVFSIYETHTEWISKGKAGVPVELGLRVCVMEDSMGFILHHRVMEKETDDQIAVLMVAETKVRFPNLRLCSFDKGFHSPQNQIDLKTKLEKVVLPRKGKLSAVDKEGENDAEFVDARRQHSAVESAINALEVHGLDMCPDHGIKGFRCYAALAVVARNIQKLGALIRSIENRKRGHYKKAA